jgi:SNF2 family DNA or RNA helicase
MLLHVLHEAGIEAEIFHSGLNGKEREDLMGRFTEERDKCMVMICSMNVNAHGINLQKLCHNCHMFDIAMADSIQDQAISRLQRLGQKDIVRVWEYRVRKSFNMKQVSNSIAKALAGVVANLNEREFELRVENNKDMQVGS